MKEHKHPQPAFRRGLLLAAGSDAGRCRLSHAAGGRRGTSSSAAPSPMTGVFAFAGIGIDAGIKDYVKMVNDAGGIKGRKIRATCPRTRLQGRRPVAAFKKITSQNKVNLYYGDSTGSPDHQPRARPQRQLDPDGRRVVCHRAERPEEVPAPVPGRALTTPRCSASCSSTSPGKPGAKVAFVYSDSEFGRDPIDQRSAGQETGPDGAVKIMTPAGSVDVSTEVIVAPRRARLHHLPRLHPRPIPEFITQASSRA